VKTVRQCLVAILDGGIVALAAMSFLARSGMGMAVTVKVAASAGARIVGIP